MIRAVGHNGMIPATVDGFVDFWKQGVDVTRHAMNAAVRVIGGDPCDDVFFRVCDAQMAWLNFINKETQGISTFLPGLSPRDMATVACFRHDRLSMLSNKISMLRQHAWERGAITGGIVRTARSSFHRQRNLEAIVGGIISSFKYDIKAKGIRAGWDVDGDDLYFVSPVVQDRAVDVLTNLISNAVKYCGEGRVLSVTRDGDAITVSDKGIGMMPEFFEQLLTPVPCRELRAENVQGEGWGMVSVVLTMEKLGWTLSGRSTPGKGTEWKLVIPEAHFVSRDTALRRDDTLPSNLSLSSLDSLATGISVLIRAEPFAGYQKHGDMLIVHNSPISQALRMTERLV
jgi:hypothetical protein